MAKIRRKYMAHFVNAGRLCNSASDEYVRLGSDLEEFVIDMNADVETSENILGQSTFSHAGYKASGEVDTYYAQKDNVLFEKLQEIIDCKYEDDRCKTTALEVHLWNQNAVDGAYPAYRQECYVVPTSCGGDTGGYQISFTVSYVGSRSMGVYDIAKKEFRAYKTAILESANGEVICDVDGSTIETALNINDTDMR